MDTKLGSSSAFLLEIEPLVDKGKKFCNFHKLISYTIKMIRGPI